MIIQDQCGFRDQEGNDFPNGHYGVDGERRREKSKRYNNESDDCCTLGSDSNSQSLISYKNQISPPSPPLSRQIPTNLVNEARIKKNQMVTLDIDNHVQSTLLNTQ